LLPEIFRQFFAPVQLDKSCEFCDSKTSIVEHQLVTLPRVLLLHLKRFKTVKRGEGYQYTKVKSRVKIPLNLSLGEMITTLSHNFRWALC